MNNIPIEIILQQAREFAKEMEPSDSGIFDAGNRLEAYASYCINNGIIPFLGIISYMSDKEIDKLIVKFGLDN